MSMLAERKVKQRWSLNPRGKAWSEDSNKFGQKLLEKMGWSKGKGLGPKEDGMVEHVKLSYKNDSKGMGYKESNDQWTEHESKFTALLESLSGGNKPSERPQIASLEQKSQSSKVRVHYKKFTRGKDLSRCSDKDLANIFGKRSLKPEVALAPSGGDGETEEPVRDSFTHNGGSMVDYFRKKLPNFGRNNSYNVGSNGVLKCPSGTESEEERLGFGCEKKRKLTGEECDVTPNKKKKKVEDDVRNVMSPSISQAKKKRKEEEEEKGLKNPAFDPLCGNVKIQRHVLNTIDEEDEKEEIAIKKKTSKVREEDSGIDNSSDDGQKVKKSDENEESFVKIETSEAKKKKKTKDGSSSFTKDVSLDSSQTVKKKKKIKNEDQSSGIENPNFDDLVGDETCQNTTFEVKRKNKKKKNEEPSSGLENPSFDNLENRQVGCQNNDFEVKRKKKKNKKREEVTNRNVDIVENGCHENNIEVIDDETSDRIFENGCHDNDFEVKRKKKKKKSEESTNRNVDIVENGCHENNIEVIDDETSDRIFENGCHDNDFEVKRKKKKKKNEESPNRNVDIVENGCHDKNIEVKNEETSNLRSENGCLDNDCEVKKKNGDCHNNRFEVKRKKKRKSEETSNRNFDSSANGRHGDEEMELSVSTENGDFEVKRKKKKRNLDLGVENPSFSTEDCRTSRDNNDFEVKRKNKKKSQSQDESFAIDNPNFDSTEDCQNSYVDSNFEVKRKEKKNKKCQSQDESLAIDNPNFDSTEDCQNSYVDSNFEVKRSEKKNKKKKKELALDNPNFEDPVQESQPSQTKEIPQEKSTEEVAQEPGFDLMLNISSTPILKPERSPKGTKSSAKRRKSVRFSDVTEQRIIPNNEDAQNRNELFDINSRIIEDGLNEMSKKIEGVQAEIENDINQAKLTRFVGEVGNPDGENEKLPDGTRLKFKYAKFGRSINFYHKDNSKAQASYKHLIKGDIVLGFNNTNLHEIAGYGVKK